MYVLDDRQVTFVTGCGGDPKPCPAGGDCPIDNPQSEVGKTIDDISRGVVKLAKGIASVAEDLWNKATS